MGRRERLEAVLQAEQEKGKLINKEFLGPQGLGPAKYRNLKLSATDCSPDTVHQQDRLASAQKKTKSSSGKGRPLSDCAINFPRRDERISVHHDERPGSTNASSGKHVGEWTMLRHFESEITQQDQVLRKQLRQKEIEDHRKQLDEQMAQKQSRIAAARQATEQQDKQMLDDLARWNRDEVKKREARRQEEAKLKRERQKQLQEVQETRAQEREKLRSQELAEVEQVKKQLAQEREAERQRQAEHKQMLVDDMSYYQQVIKEKEASKLRAKEYDKEMQKQYEMLLEEQDSQRSLALKAMFDVAMERSEMAGTEVVRAQREKEAKAAAAIQKAAKDQEKMWEQREFRQAQHKKKINNEFVSELDRQMAHKDMVKQAKLNEKYALSEAVKAKDARDRYEDECALRQERHKNLEHRIALEEQICEGKARIRPDDEMTHVERRLNAPLLQQAHEVLSA